MLHHFAESERSRLVSVFSCSVSTFSALSQVDNMDEMHQDPFMDVGYLNGAQDAPTRGRGGPGRGRGGPPLPMPGARYKSFLITYILVLKLKMKVCNMYSVACFVCCIYGDLCNPDAICFSHQGSWHAPTWWSSSWWGSQRRPGKRSS